LAHIDNNVEIAEAHFGCQAEVFCVKDSFDKSLRSEARADAPPEIMVGDFAMFRELVGEYVDFGNKVSYYGSQLLYFHVLRAMRPDGDGFPLAPINHGFVYHVLQSLCGSDAGASPHLLASRNAFLAGLGVEGIAGLDPANSHGKTQVMANLAMMEVANLQNHVVANFEPFMKRLILFALPRGPGFQQKVRVKLAHHVYRLVTGFETYWPHSVERTDVRVVAVQAAVIQMLESGYDFQRGNDPLWPNVIKRRFVANPKSLFAMMYDLHRRLDVPNVYRDEPQDYVTPAYLKRKLRKLDSHGLFSVAFKGRLAHRLKERIASLKDLCFHQDILPSADDHVDECVYFFGFEINHGNAFYLLH
jgi:hypothetical protein